MLMKIILTLPTLLTLAMGLAFAFGELSPNPKVTKIGGLILAAWGLWCLAAIWII